MQAASDRVLASGADVHEATDLWRLTALSILAVIVSSVRRRHFPVPVLV